MVKQYSKGGWHGDSRGHALAARGVRLYARKSNLMDPVFAARKSEQDVPSSHILDLVKQGYTFDQIRKEQPEADSEVIRHKGIKALDVCSGSNTMGSLNNNGVDMTVRMAKVNPTMRQRSVAALNDSQKASFLPPIKVQLLKKRLGEIEQK